ncbi:MAG: hypothetical protein MK135_10625, partial [Polyangiaceae bacterium]|nr:hypothetical protein [Polyangiaceae bacterium]
MSLDLLLRNPDGVSIYAETISTVNDSLSTHEVTAYGSNTGKRADGILSNFDAPYNFASFPSEIPNPIWPINTPFKHYRVMREANLKALSVLEVEGDTCGGQDEEDMIWREHHLDSGLTYQRFAIDESGRTNPLETTLELVVPADSFDGTINDLTVTIEAGGINGFLVTLTSPAPNSTTVTLSPSSSTGVTSNEHKYTTFDDASTNLLSSESVTRNYKVFKPHEALSAFDGKDPEGTWTLKVENEVSSSVS